MPPSIESRVKKCFYDTRLFQITEHALVDVKLAHNERILGVYFNKAMDDYSDGFIVSSEGLHLLLPKGSRFVPYDSIRAIDMHKNKHDQGRDVKYRYVELILKSGERVKVYMFGEYKNGCLDLYNLDRFLRYMYRDKQIAKEKTEREKVVKRDQSETVPRI